MPTVTKVGTQPVVATAPATTTPVATAAAPKAETLSRGDAYVQSTTSKVVDTGLAVANHTTVLLNNLSNLEAVTDYGSLLDSAKRNATNAAVSSGVRNGIAVARKKATLPEAGGRVAGDVVVATAKGVISTAAANAAIYGLAKAGMKSFPVLIGGMAVGFVAHKVAGKVIDKTGVQAKITDKVTEQLEKLKKD